MIIKIKSHKNKNAYQNLLTYMLNDKDRLFDEKGYSFTVSHNIKGNNINEWVKQYQVNEQNRRLKRVNSVLLTHEIISFHKDDATNISLDKLEDITRQYVKERNINGMYVAVPHFNKEHYHIHICASGIEYKTGKIRPPATVEARNNMSTGQKNRAPRPHELGQKISAAKKGKPRSEETKKKISEALKNRTINIKE